KEVILLVEFKTLTSEPFGKNRPTTNQIYGYGEIADIETFSSLPLFPSIPSILDTPIDMPCTLLELPFLPLTPKNKNIYALIDLSISYSDDSSYLTDSSSFSLLAPLDKGRLNKEIRVPSQVSENLILSICYDFNTGGSDQVEWYSFLDLGTLKIGEDEFASDASSTIDEINRQLKINKKKIGPLNIRCYANEPIYNCGIQDREFTGQQLFDYFYEKRQDPYQLGKLEP
ncbi:17278_t:CDS:2, partial [Gigaspora rosea]